MEPLSLLPGRTRINSQVGCRMLPGQAGEQLLRFRVIPSSISTGKADTKRCLVLFRNDPFPTPQRPAYEIDEIFWPPG